MLRIDILIVHGYFDSYYQRWVGQFEHPSTGHTIDKSIRAEFDTRSQASVDSITESIDRLEMKYKRLVRQRQLQCEIDKIKNEQLRILDEIKQKEAEIEREMISLETDSKTEIPTAKCDIRKERNSVKSVLILF